MKFYFKVDTNKYGDRIVTSTRFAWYPVRIKQKPLGMQDLKVAWSDKYVVGWVWLERVKKITIRWTGNSGNQWVDSYYTDFEDLNNETT